MQNQLIDYQRAHALMLEVLLSNKNSPKFENFLEVYLIYMQIIQLYNNSKIDDLQFIKAYNEYLLNNQLTFQNSDIVYNEIIHKKYQELHLQSQKIPQILNMIHSQLNLKIKFLADYDELYFMLDSQKIGYLCEDQLLFLFFSLILIELPKKKNIDLHSCFKEFWLSLQQFNKVPLRIFKRFLLEQKYQVDQLRIQLNKVLSLLKLQQIPNIRMDILQHLQTKNKDYTQEMAYELIVDLPIEYSNNLSIESQDKTLEFQYVQLYRLTISKQRIYKILCFQINFNKQFLTFHPRRKQRKINKNLRSQK